jgi:3',5'-cyclic AMP phosphodiesterase CpdA
MRKKYLVFVWFVLMFCGASFLTAFAQDVEKGHFYFVQITDTHFGDHRHFERTRKIVEQINKLPMEIKFVVHTGDIVMDNIDDEKSIRPGLDLLKNIRVPVHYVPGNHDIVQKRLNGTHNTYKKYFGELVSRAQYQGVTFIFLYTEPLAGNFHIDGYHPMHQLESLLEKAGNHPVVIFHHRPSVDSFYKNRMHEGWDPEIRSKWIRLINSYNIKAVIAGHFHRDEHHWLGEVPLYVSPPVAGYFGRQGAFRIYEYKKGKLGYRTQYVESNSNY